MPVIHTLSKLILISGLLIVSGCSNTQRKQPPSNSTDTWSLKGKMGIRYQNNAKSANVSWINQGNDFEISLYGLLGIGGATIYRNDHTVTVNTARKSFTANNAEEAVYQVLGLQLPVSGLQYWVQGIPAPQQPSEHLERNSLGQISAFHQQGWTLKYVKYTSEKPHALPTKVVITRDQIKLTLIIKKWNHQNSRP